MPDTYNISYSELQNQGSPLNPILLFTNLEITKNGSNLFGAKKIEIGLPLSLNLIFGRMELNSLQIKDAFIVLESSQNKPASFPKIIFSQNIALDIANFSISNMESNLLINGELDSLLPGLANGYFNITHGEHISNFSVSSDGSTSNFFLSFKEFNWMQFSLNSMFSPLSSMYIGGTLLGSMNSQGSSMEGSISYQETNFGSMTAKKNHGSFVFKSNHKMATLLLKEFLQPFVDEQYPILFNLTKQSIAVPKLFLNNQLIQQNTPKFSNLALENLVASFDGGILRYSGAVSDLDLVDVYFSEIINLKGGFSGMNKAIDFYVESSQSFIRDGDDGLHPLAINAAGTFIDQEFNLEGHIKELIGDLRLRLSFSPDQQIPFTLKLSGQNISKKIILSSIPRSLAKVRSFIDLNIKPGKLNGIFLEYLAPTRSQDQHLILKLSMEDAALAISPEINLRFGNNLLEIQNEHLYFFASPGAVNQFSIQSIAATLNFSNQMLWYKSTHNFSSSDMQAILQEPSQSLGNIVAQGFSKGQFNFSSQDHHNFLSIKAQDFSVPIYNEYFLQILQAQLFISNLSQVNGLMDGQILGEDASIFVKGKNLLSSYELDFSTQIPLQTEDIFPQSFLGKLSGKDIFYLELAVGENLLPRLNIFSDLKNIQFDSNFSFLSKKKSSTLPTQIVLSNFSKPALFLSNELMELNLNSLQSLEGHLVIGGELPPKFSYLKQAPGLNIYLALDLLTSKMIDSWPSPQASIPRQPIQNFIVDIQNLEILGNQYNEVTGIFSIGESSVKGQIESSKLNVKLNQDNSGFLKLEFNNTHVQDAHFLSAHTTSGNMPKLNARIIAENSSLGELKIKSLDMYLLKNKNITTFNNINLSSNFLSISPLSDQSNAYFSIDDRLKLFKLKGKYLMKDSSRIPVIQNLANFSYFNGDINLQWKDLQKLQDIEGNLNFILKDLLVENKTSSSIAFNLLGVLNLKNILGKVANLDLTMSEFTSTQLSRVEGDLIFSKSKARLASPIFIETNAAKMKWIGSINKNNKGELSELDLNLDLRVRIGENIPWYSALLGGLPAIAGSAIISEIFETNIDSLSNYQYEVSGFLAEPKIHRIN